MKSYEMKPWVVVPIMKQDDANYIEDLHLEIWYN